MIQTVCGPIEADELGVTMCHEHLSVDLSGVRGDADSVFSDSPLVRDEVRLARELGVRSIIEVSCADMGRDPRALRSISRACGVNIVCSTGFYLDAYHPEWVRRSSVAGLEDFFEREFREGIGDTGIKPGVIGEIAGEDGELTASERRVMAAAARASERVRCAVTTHCQMGKMALEQADLLLSEGADPCKVVLGHLDLADDMGYYETILSLGVNIGFDTCGKTAYLDDAERIRNIAALIEKGYSGQIVLSTDVSRKSYMVGKGGHGYGRVMSHIIPEVRRLISDEGAICDMLVRNPARIFDIEGADS